MGILSRGSPKSPGSNAAETMPKPKVAKLNTANRGTFGAGVRFTPGDQATARSGNQTALKTKITPSADPVGALVQEMKQPSGMSGRLPQGSQKAYDWLKGRAQSPAIGQKAGYEGGRPLKVDDGILAYQELLPRQAQGFAIHPFKQEMSGVPFDIGVTFNATPHAKSRILAHELSHTLLGHTDMFRFEGAATAAVEAEAEAGSYGVMNRLYPWNQSHKALSAKFMGEMEQTHRDADTLAHLSDPAVKARVNQVAADIVPNPRKPFKSITPALYGQPPAPGQPPTAAPPPPKMASESFILHRTADSPIRNAQAFTLSSDRQINERLRTTGIMGDNVGMGLRGKKQPAAPAPAAAAQSGDSISFRRPTMTGPERFPLGSYSFNSLDVNTLLRHGPESVSMPAMKQTMASNMQASLEKLPPVSGEFHRDVLHFANAKNPEQTASVLESLRQLKPGDVYQDPGFMSTNTHETTSYAASQRPGKVADYVTLSVKGSSGRDLSPFSKFAPHRVKPGAYAEQEVLFPPSARFKVVGSDISGKPGDVIHLEEEGYQAPKMAGDVFKFRDPSSKTGITDASLNKPQTISTNAELNKLLTTTGTSGDNVGMGLRGKVSQNVTRSQSPDTPVTTTSPDVPTTKPTKLTQQAGDRLFSNSERARLNLRGEHIGVGSNYLPVKPRSTAMVKLSGMIDYLKKGIYTPELFRGEVLKAGLQPHLESLRFSQAQKGTLGSPFPSAVIAEEPQVVQPKIDNVGMGLRGKVSQNVTRSNSAPDTTVLTPEPIPDTKPTKLTQQAGDRLFSNSERATLNARGSYVGVGSNPAPVKSENPAMVKLGGMVDFLKKGIYTPETFQSEVQRGGLQGKLDSIKQLGQTLFGSRGGGEIYSGSMQQSAQLKGMPSAVKLPQSTQVLGSQGETLDSFRINQPPRQGAPLSAPSRNLEFNIGLGKSQAGGFAGDNVPRLDPMTKALGYKITPPSQTGLPWSVAADPKTGEMVNMKGAPLPPLVGPSFPTSNAPAPVQQSAVTSQQSVFKQGVALSTGTAETPQKQSFFKRTPEATAGMSLGDRLKFAAGRAAGDVAADASRGQYWRYNHPLAIAGSAFERLAGGNKIGGAAAAFAGIQALGQTSNQFDLTNPGQAFRPKGMSAAYPVNDSDKTQIAPGPLGYAKELLGRYIFNKGGNLLPYQQFSKERPDINQSDYQRYSQYLKGGGANGPMPAGTVDVGGFGVLKGNINGINGPEARLAGFSVTPLGAVAGTATATGVASIFNKGLRGTALKGLGVVGAGLDYSNRLQQGQNASNAALGTLSGIEGGLQGGMLGAKLAPGGLIGKGIGALVGGGLGAVGAGVAFDAVSQNQKAGAAALEKLSQPAIKQGGVLGTLNNVANEARKFTSDPVGYVKQQFGGGQPAPGAAQSDGDQAMKNATDHLLQASAKYRLVRQPDGSIKSVVNDTGSNVRGEVEKVDDGDTYKVRTFNPKTQQFESNNVRLQGADTRETADHASTGSFINHMIGKQKREQGFNSDSEVFNQGEKDKQAAEKLVPVGSVPYFQGKETAAHDRPARDVATETGHRDLGETLVKQGNAVVYPSKGGSSSSDGSSGSSSSGSSSGSKSTGMSDGTREKVARLQYGAAASPEQRAALLAKQTKAKADRDQAYADPNSAPDARLGLDQALKDANTEYESAQGGQGDRNLESKERQTTQTNQTKLTGIGLQNQGKLQNTDLTGRYKIANTQEVNKGRLQNTDLTGRYKIANTQEQNKGRLQNTDLTGRYKLANTGLQNQGKLQVADLTSGRKLQGTVYTANSKLQGTDLTSGRKLQGMVYSADQKVNQEGVKQAGAGNVATIKAGGAVGAASLGADAKVKVAGLGLQGTEYKADATVRVATINSSAKEQAAQTKAEAEGSKSAATYMSSLNKSSADSMATEDKARIARFRSLGVY